VSLHPYLVIRLALCRPELLKALQLDLFGGADVASEPRAQLSLFGGTVPAAPRAPRAPRPGAGSHMPPGGGWRRTPKGWARGHENSNDYEWRPYDWQEQEARAALEEHNRRHARATPMDTRPGGGVESKHADERHEPGPDLRPASVLSGHDAGGPHGAVPQDGPVAPGGAGAPRPTVLDAEADPVPVDSGFLKTPRGPEVTPDPAVALWPEYLPPIDDDCRLPESVRNFPRPSGPFASLKPHQTEAAERILTAWKHHDAFLLQDEAGLGKTLGAMAAMVAQGGKRNLIVVPTGGKANMLAQWQKEAGDLYGIKFKSLAELAADPAADGWCIVAYNDLTRYARDSKGRIMKQGKVTVSAPEPAIFNDLKWDTVAFDECQALMKHGKTNENGVLLQKHAEKVLYMSATPFERLTDMHYLVKLGLWSEEREQLLQEGVTDYEWEAFKAFAIKAGAVVKGGTIGNPSSPAPMAAIAAKMHCAGMSLKRGASLAGISSVFDKVAAETHPRLRTQMEVANEIVGLAEGMVPAWKIKAAFNLWAQSAWEAEKTDDAIAAGRRALAEDPRRQLAFYTYFRTYNHGHLAGLATQMENRALRIADSENPANLAIAKDLMMRAGIIRDLLANKMPPQRNPTQEISEAFGGVGHVAQIHGGTRAEPAEEQAAYQRGEKKVVVATMHRGGTGVSLHDTKGSAPRVQINLAIPWGGVLFTQVSGRSHRLGSKSATEMHWIVGDDPSEQHLAACVAVKLRSMGSLCTGDPEHRPDASEMAQWESNAALLESDDMAETLESVTRRAEEEHAIEESRDAEGEAADAKNTFAAFAARWAGGEDVIQTRANERAVRQKAESWKDARRAAQQLRQGGGLTVTWRAGLGVYEVDAEGLTEPQHAIMKKRDVGGVRQKWGGRTVMAYHVKPEGVRELSKWLGHDHLQVTPPSTERLQVGEFGRLDAKFHARDLRLQLIDSDGEGDVYLITGNTFKVKRAWSQDYSTPKLGTWSPALNGWLTRKAALPKVLDRVEGIYADGTFSTAYHARGPRSFRPRRW